MSTLIFIRGMIAAGFSHEDALKAAEVFEAMQPKRSKGAERQARYEERRRQKASEAVRPDATDAPDDVVSLPSSPQTPQHPTHPRGDISTREGLTRTEAARGFAAFWAEYPKRVGKDAAAKSFERAVRRAEGPDPLETIMAGLRRALPGWDDPQFIPNPATWLNQGRWDDDAPTPRIERTHDRPSNDRSHARALWTDIIADSDRSGAGPAQPLRLAG